MRWADGLQDKSEYHVINDTEGAFLLREQIRALEVVLLLVLILPLMLMLMLMLPPTFQAQSNASGLAAPHPGVKPITATFS